MARDQLVSECWASAQNWHEKYLKAEAEIEQLKARGFDCLHELLESRSQAGTLQEEIERLRAALQQIADLQAQSYAMESVDVARRALDRHS